MVESTTNVEGHNISALDDITRKSRLTKKTEVHTGIRHHPMSLVDEDNNLHIPAYMSTLEHKSIADKFDVSQARRKDTEDKKEPEHVLSIAMEKGQYGVNISGKSVYGTNNGFSDDEAERSLPRNAKLNIHPVPGIRQDSTGREIHTWKAKVVSQDWN